MDTDIYNQVVLKAPFGYAFHKIIVDTAGRPVDYEFLEVNPAFEKLTGLISHEILGKTITKVIPEIAMDKFDWIGFYGEIALNGGENEFEQYSKAINRWFRVQAYSPKQFYFITIFYDITDRKSTEDLLRETICNYSDILETISEGIVHTTLTGTILSTNKSFENILGLTSEAIVGKNILTLANELLNEKNRKDAIPFLKSLIQGKDALKVGIEYKIGRAHV